MKEQTPGTRQLLFKGKDEKPPVKPGQGLLGKTVSGELHRKVAQNEEDNTGLQALHSAERVGESALHTAQVLRYKSQQHNHKKQEQAKSHSQSGSYQRKAIRREYMKASAGRSTNRNAQKAVKKTAETSESVITFIAKRKSYLVILALVAMLMFLMNALSSCTPLVEAALHALVMGTYPAEERDVKAAERAYKSKEDELKRELERYERYHPGYDEYVVEADTGDIWHDPYALISIISAYHGGEEWTIDDVYGTIEMLFNWQYKVTETVRTVTRYRVEGETRIPYAHRICTVTMEAKNLSHAPVYIMSREKMGLYALYMSTLGNMPHLFSGAHVSTLKEPLRYDVPQELLDADPQFALLVEAANSCLGYPYVWGGYDPSTSFDCSGFISWLFTSTGVNNIGHMGATTLYGYSAPIRSEDAKPGDVIFFQGTMGEDTGGITHCGLYVGNNMMIHCGNPCSYADLTDSYWQQHFYGFGRLYDH